MRRILLLLLAACAAVASSAAFALGPTDGADMAGAASATQSAVRGERTVVAPPLGVERSELRAVFDLINLERSRFGLAPLRHHVLLSQASQAHSDDMAVRNLLTHTGSNGETSADRIAATGYRYSMWAANVAAGQTTAASLLTSWMGSPPHRANLLNGQVTEIGLGLAYSNSGRPYWTVTLAQPAG